MSTSIHEKIFKFIGSHRDLNNAKYEDILYIDFSHRENPRNSFKLKPALLEEFDCIYILIMWQSGVRSLNPFNNKIRNTSEKAHKFMAASLLVRENKGGYKTENGELKRYHNA